MASRGLNRVLLIGNLGRDPELRYTAAGKAVATLSLAVSRVSGTGESRQEETEWFRVVAWERLAETCHEYLKKGSKVFIEGRLQSRKYTDRDGVERTAVEVVASDMLMLDARPASAPAPAGVAAGAASEPGQDELDELPF
jgi:single-strand DNA-binding protein